MLLQVRESGGAVYLCGPLSNETASIPRRGRRPCPAQIQGRERSERHNVECHGRKPPSCLAARSWITVENMGGPTWPRPVVPLVGVATQPARWVPPVL